MSTMHAITRITRYEVSCIPDTNINSHAFTITVEYRGDDRWAVKRSGSCLAADGTWDYESVPSERTDEWLSTHRFDLNTALRLARQAAPQVTVNGFTVADVLAERTRPSGRPKPAVS